MVAFFSYYLSPSKNFVRCSHLLLTLSSAVNIVIYSFKVDFHFHLCPIKLLIFTSLEFHFHFFKVSFHSFIFTFILQHPTHPAISTKTIFIFTNTPMTNPPIPTHLWHQYQHTYDSNINSPMTGLQVSSSAETFLYNQYWRAVFDQRTRFCYKFFCILLISKVLL